MPELFPVFETFPVLETRRCILRAVQTEDAADLLRLMGDPEVNRYLGRHPMASIEDAVKRVEVYQSVFQEQTGIIWAITRRGEPGMIGTCLLWNLVKAHFRAELGYALTPAWWGQGLITEVISTVLDFGFNRIGLHSIEAVIDPDNQGSRRVLEKQGFIQEAYFREDYYHPVLEQFTDTAVLSLLQKNWIGQPVDQD